MIVLKINLDCITVQPPESDPPISAGVDRITTAIMTDERVKVEAGQVHVLRSRCVVEGAQNIGNALWVLDTKPAPVSGREESFRGLVSERADHGAM